jgi:hypothetical protein
VSRPVLDILDKEIEKTSFLPLQEQVGERQINILAGRQGQVTELPLCPGGPISTFIMKIMTSHQACTQAVSWCLLLMVMVIWYFSRRLAVKPEHYSV